MPQIMIYAPRAIFTSEDLQTLNRALAQVETVSLAAVKSRVVIADAQCTGGGEIDVQQVFVRCGVLPGRTPQILEAMRDALMACARMLLADTSGLEIAVEVYEMPYYVKT